MAKTAKQKAETRAAKYARWKDRTENADLYALKERTARACMCGIVKYDSTNRPRDIVVSPLGDEWCRDCYGITADGQTDINALIGQLAED